MDEKIITKKNFFYPPGGILLWIVIFLELFTFSFGLIAMVTYGNENRQLFHDSSLSLNRNLALINTIILLSSGYFMAETIRNIKRKDKSKSRLFLWLTILFGILFVIIKLYDYTEKMNAGIGISTNIFYTFFWFLTFFHFLHVVLGIFFLLYFVSQLNSIIDNSNLENIEAGAAFWHMCDLIWLILFPVVYLIY